MSSVRLWFVVVLAALSTKTAVANCLYFSCFASLNMLSNKQCAPLLESQSDTRDPHRQKLPFFVDLVASKLLADYEWTLAYSRTQISAQSQAAKLSFAGQWSLTRASLVMSKFSAVRLLIASIAPISATVCLSPSRWQGATQEGTPVMTAGTGSLHPRRQ